MATTKAPHATYRIFAQVAPHLNTVEMGGVVGDARHGSGYHLSPAALKARGLGGDYSIQCPADKDGGDSYASAIDLTFGSLSELVTVTKRLRKACEDDDPRVEPLREHIGSVDGRNVCGYNRVSTGSGSRARVGWHATGFSDKSHLWHAHLSILRRYNQLANDMTGLAEIIAGVAPGALGWKDPELKAEAKPTTKPKPVPVVTTPQSPVDTPTVVEVSLKALTKAFKLDPDRPQGGTTAGSEDDVKAVEWALMKAKLLPKEFADDGSAGSSTGVAYAKWQRKLGYRGADADGMPGKVSLSKLGASYGFKVTA